jgi:uncharacterized DUF497 family protein
MALGFTWDPAKSAANVRKHGVSFEDASTAFGDPHSITVADPLHSAAETRFALIGSTSRGLIVIVSHTERNDTIRIISARKATRRERATYEEDQ